MAQVVEIHSPRIARALGKNLEDMPNRMVPPDASVDSRSVGLGRARPADGGVCEHAVAAVEPAIGPPDERIERLVRVLRAPAVEQDRGLSVGDVVAVGVGDEKEIGRRAHPDAAKPHRQTTDEVEPLLEDLPGVEHVVTVGVLEDEDPVAGVFVCDLPRVGITLRHPEPAAVVEAHRDRLADVGLGREEFDREAGRRRHRLGRIGRREAIGHRHPPSRLGLFHSCQPHLPAVGRIRAVGCCHAGHDEGGDGGGEVENRAERHEGCHGASCNGVLASAAVLQLRSISRGIPDGYDVLHPLT